MTAPTLFNAKIFPQKKTTKVPAPTDEHVKVLQEICASGCMSADQAAALIPAGLVSRRIAVNAIGERTSCQWQLNARALQLVPQLQGRTIETPAADAFDRTLEQTSDPNRTAVGSRRTTKAADTPAAVSQAPAVPVKIKSRSNKVPPLPRSQQRITPPRDTFSYACCQAMHAGNKPLTQMALLLGLSSQTLRSALRRNEFTRKTYQKLVMHFPQLSTAPQPNFPRTEKAHVSTNQSKELRPSAAVPGHRRVDGHHQKPGSAYRLSGSAGSLVSEPEARTFGTCQPQYLPCCVRGSVDYSLQSSVGSRASKRRRKP